MSTTTKTDDSLGTIAELQRDLARQHVHATISELAEMPVETREQARDWLVNPKPDALPACLVAFYDEPEPAEEPPEITDQELANVLMLVEIAPTDEQVASWTPAERDAVHAWCDAVFNGRDVPELFPACLADVVPVDMQADPVGYLKGRD